MREKYMLAYGANLNVSRLRSLGVGFRSADFAVLPEHTVSFNKRDNDNPDYAAANIVSREGKYVEGIVFGVTQHDLNTMDSQEPGYHREIKKVFLPNGTDQEVDVYVADPEYVIHKEDKLPVASSYGAQILVGGKEIWTRDYKESMEKHIINRLG